MAGQDGGAAGQNSRPVPQLFGSGAARRTRRSRVTLTVALVLWVPLVALIAGIVLHARDAHRAEAEARLRATAQNVAVAVDAALRTQVTSLMTLVRALPPDAAVLPEDFAARARIAAEVLGGVLLLYGADGALLATTSGEEDALRARIGRGMALGPTAAMVERIRRTGQPALSDLFISPVRPRPLVSLGVAVPAGGEPGEAAPGEGGAGQAAPRPRLHLAFEPSALQALLAALHTPPGVRVSIRDRGFGLVASSDPAQQPGPPIDGSWLLGRLGEAPRALLTAPDAEGGGTMIAVERLALDPGWTVLAAEPLAHLEAGQLAGLGWPATGSALAVLGIVAVVAAARRDHVLRAVEETDLLRDAQAQVTQLHEYLPAVLVLREIDAQGRTGRLLYRAGDLEGVLGWPAASLSDDALGDLAESPEHLRRFRADVVAQGHARLDLRIRQPDGGWRWVRLRTRRLGPAADGRVVSVGYVIDISEQRAAQMQAQAAGRLASMTEMAHGLAHELQQPLQAALLQAGAAAIHAHALQEAPDLPAALRPVVAALEAAIDGSMRQIDRTGRLTEHLRRFARGPTEGAGPEPVALDTAVEEALMLVRRGLEGAGITLDIALGDPAPVVLGQRIGLEQILINLLNNARDALALRPEGAPRRISLTAARVPGGDAGGDAVLLEVADTGGGIPEHIIAQVFDPLVSTKGLEEGTGLGLAICRGLARDMDGEIGVRNGPEGAIFTLRLRAA